MAQAVRLAQAGQQTDCGPTGNCLSKPLQATDRRLLPSSVQGDDVAQLTAGIVRRPPLMTMQRPANGRRFQLAETGAAPQKPVLTVLVG